MSHHRAAAASLLLLAAACSSEVETDPDQDCLGAKPEAPACAVVTCDAGTESWVIDEAGCCPEALPIEGEPCTTLASETCHYGLNVFDAYVDFVCEGSVWKQTSFSSLQFDPIANCTAASGRAECLAFPGCSYRSGTWDQTTACGTSGAFEGCVSEEPCASSDQCWDPTACEPVTLTCAPGEPCPTMLCCEQVQ